MLVECGCGYLDELSGLPRDNVFLRARDLLAEHRIARGCRGAAWRMEAVALDSDLGRMDARAVLAAIDVADLLEEAI